MTNLKDPPATSYALPTTSEGAWAFFFSDNAAMPTIHIQISSIFLSLVEIKKCTNLQQIRSVNFFSIIQYCFTQIF